MNMESITPLQRANLNREKAKKKTTKEKGAFTGKEKELQKLCENYLKAVNLRFIHIPDNMLSYLSLQAPIWIKTLASRALKGIPDLMIFKSDKSLLIELKSAKGKESQGQKSWRNGYDAQEVEVNLVRSFEEFRKLVDKFNLY